MTRILRIQQGNTRIFGFKEMGASSSLRGSTQKISEIITGRNTGTAWLLVGKQKSTGIIRCHYFKLKIVV